MEVRYNRVARILTVEGLSEAEAAELLALLRNWLAKRWLHQASWRLPGKVEQIRAFEFKIRPRASWLCYFDPLTGKAA